MTQSNKNIRFATGAAYVGGTYDGQPNKVEPSSGLKTSGYVPGTKLPFPRLNWSLNAIGELLDGILDLCAINWSVLETSVGSVADSALVIITLTHAQHVTSFSRSVSLVNFPDHLIALATVGGNRTIAFTIDGHVWVMGVGSGITTNVCGPIAGVAGTLAVVLWDPDNGAVRKTLDGGATWADAGDLDATMDDVTAGVFGRIGCYLQAHDRWIVFGDIRINTSDTLGDVGWTVRTPPAGWVTAGGIPHCVAVGSDGALVGLQTFGGALYTNDGLTYSWIDTATGSQLISVAFSEAHQLWVALCADGTVWTSPTGAAAWTEQTTPLIAGAINVECLGRSIVVVGQSIAVSNNGGASWVFPGPIAPAFEDANATDAWDVLVPFNGTLLAGHYVNLPSGDLKSVRTLAAPFALGGFIPA